ncbi:MAG: RNP-1 like protein RNA-binding protein [Parcubacteria group bacterium GW2011_GWA1_36_12]|nr:MAG: RNP-1 like protein RNA-binding protein [Parcubacteria group bacterium GW2011_GWA1_36_12]
MESKYGIQMGKKLYVGSLSYDTTDASLKEAFSQAGTVESASVITDKMSGRSRGFGFVEMATDEEAQKAIEMLNGVEVDGRKVTVNEARPMTDRPPRPAGGGFSRGGQGGGFNRGGGRGFGGGGRDY